jgi:hypothetical protein
MPKRTIRRATAGAALGLLVPLFAARGDDDAASPATITSTTVASPTTTTDGGGLSEAAALDVVRTFAEDQVGMVDPVVGSFETDDDAPPRATVEVRTRREGGAEDPTLTPTVVRLVGDGDQWRIVSASGDFLSIESPPEGTRLSAGFVTPSGRASAFEGTVVVQALLGTQVLGEQVTTAEGIEDAPWSARVETGTAATGDGYIFAFTTAGTEQGPPVFALVPVVFGPDSGGAALPTEPQAYAQAALDAWSADDAATLERLATPDAVESLGQFDLGGQSWTTPECEGAAGSTYCTWTSATAKVVLRVGNEAASTGQPQAVIEAEVTVE